MVSSRHNFMKVKVLVTQLCPSLCNWDFATWTPLSTECPKQEY